MVVSLREFERSRTHRARFSEAYGTFLESHRLTDVGLDAGFATSLRHKDAGRKVSL